jgi:acetolactate synthase I/III small subunit
MAKFNIAVLVNDKAGVLNRVTSMFRRRRFNIDSLTVSETEDEKFSRITVTFKGDECTKDQLISQLYKLPDVRSIKELSLESSISCELLLIKMANEASSREEIKAAAEAFKAQTIHYTKDAIILKVTGESKKIDDFIEIMRDFNILEICRTGVVSLETGSTTMKEDK